MSTTRSLTVGLDLGSVRDYSALVVVERVRTLPPGLSVTHWERRLGTAAEPALTEEVRVVHLQRWPAGTSYPVVVADVAQLMRAPELELAWLSFDATGVGVAVKHLLTQEWMAGRMGTNPPQAVTLTGGDTATATTLPKRDLMSALQVLLMQNRLKVPAGLPLADVLDRELGAFRLKLSASGRDTFEIARNDDTGHGDLTIALALAARRANVSVPVPVEEAN